MAKLAILVPDQGMCAPAEQLIGLYPRIECLRIEYIRTDQAEAEAAELEASGCDVIVARGLQAKRIKRAVKLPVIEICVTAQEVAKLVVDIREELGLPTPRIGLIGHTNMLCSTDQFDYLFQVELRRYHVDTEDGTEDALRAAVDQAAAEGCQAVIGGSVVCGRALERGLCRRFLTSGWESLKAALDVADRVCYAIELEKSNNAQIDTMLNFTFNGIVQVDAAGMILRANHVAYNLLNCEPKDMMGRELVTVFPSLTREVLDKTLREGEEAYAILVPVNRTEMVVNLAPISIDGRITGALLTLQEGRRIIDMSSELLRDIYLRGYKARYSFDMLPQASEQSRELIRLAERISKYTAPVLITGEAGCGKGIMAHCIHNAGFNRENAFIALDCRAYQADTLDTLLFGNYTTRKDTASCMVEIAQNGTIYFSHVEALSPELQYKLLRLIQGTFMRNGSNRPTAASVRVIAGTEINLIARVEEGQFRSDLYYALNALGLQMSPLRQRREDIMGWVALYLKQWQERYDRFVTLTHGAEAFLEKYDWPGNLDQVNSVCEQIVLLAERRNVDEVFLRRRIEQLTPRLLPGTGQTVIFRDEKAVRIEELLKKHSGSRQKVAEELGVSKTTLWRYMKKYGVEKDFS